MRPLRSAIASIACVVSLAAQRPWDWERTPVPALDISGPPLTTAVDPGSGLLITLDVASDGTWAWNGTEWFRPRGNYEGQQPAGRWEGWLLADHAHGRLLLVGGRDRNWQLDPSIWAFEAGRWRVLSANSGFAMTRSEGGMAYDERRDRLVAFGLQPASGTAVTSEWDGTSWQPIATPVQPSVRGWCAMAYDASRQRTVLFGGGLSGVALGDTWEWDGVAWRQVIPPASPPPGAGILTFDPVGARCVLQPFGGGAHGWDGSIWSWNGAVWSRTWDLARYADHLGLAVFDARRQSLFFLGQAHSWGFQSNELTEWDGTRLWRRHGGAMPPGRLVENPRRGALLSVADWDPNVVFARGADGWHARDAAPAMPRRWDFGVACAPDRDRLVLFGGVPETMPGGRVDETFEWDGTGWTAMPTAIRPPARTRPGMAFDATTSEVLMFGGTGAQGDLADTWSWDGATWRQRAVAVAPSARSDPAMVADPVRRVIVLHGGVSNWQALGDTWEWDGGQWHLGAPLLPSGPVGGRLAFDAASQTMVAMARVRVQNTWIHWYEYPLWSWDGAAWTSMNQPNVLQWPPPNGWSAGVWDGLDLAWDPRARSMVAIDGLWRFTREVGPVRKLASAFRSSSRCAGSAGVLSYAEPVYLGEGTSLAFHPVWAPSGGPVFLLAGVAAAQWNGLTLPIDLTPQGATGCLLQVAPQIVSFVGTLTQAGLRCHLDVPNDPRLAGLAFDFQGLLLAPGVNPAGALLSDRARLRIGQR